MARATCDRVCSMHHITLFGPVLEQLLGQRGWLMNWARLLFAVGTFCPGEKVTIFVKWRNRRVNTRKTGVGQNCPAPVYEWLIVVSLSVAPSVSPGVRGGHILPHLKRFWRFHHYYWESFSARTNIRFPFFPNIALGVETDPRLRTSVNDPRSLPGDLLERTPQAMRKVINGYWFSK